MYLSSISNYEPLRNYSKSAFSFHIYFDCPAKAWPVKQRVTSSILIDKIHRVCLDAGSIFVLHLNNHKESFSKKKNTKFVPHTCLKK